MVYTNTLEVNSKPVPQLSIKCGIYQGDQIINKSGYGYKYQNDDIKLYTKNERDIDSLIHLTRIYSNDIRMSFGLNKFGRMVSQRGRMIRTEGFEQPEDNIVEIQDSYRYLGIPQANGNH